MKEIFRKLIFCISIIVFLITSFELVTIYLDYKKIDDTYNDVIYNVVKQEEETSKYLTIDWDSLHDINDEVIAWLYIEDTNINYPIMHYSDNDYYLYKDIHKDYSIAGSIFVDARNEQPFIDNNTVIHGHNMKNGSMFNSLAKYVTSEDYRKDKSEVHIYFPDNTVSVYSIFSANIINSTSDLYLPEQLDRNVYYEQATRNNVMPQSDVDLNLPTLMMSTCVSASTDVYTRYAIHAVLQDSHIDLSLSH